MKRRWICLFAASLALDAAAAKTDGGKSTPAPDDDSFARAMAESQTNSFSSPVGLEIPDDSAAGIANTINVPASSLDYVQSVNVSVTLQIPPGGSAFTGDLFAYVQHGDKIAVLMNRPGRAFNGDFGYDDNISLSVTFADDARQGDIHSYRFTLNGSHTVPVASPLSGYWQPDGRATDPDEVVESDPRILTLSNFVGLQQSGDWTIYFSDLSGGGSYILTEWSLTIVSIPEPSTWALLSIGLLAAMRRRSKTRFR